MKLKILLGLFIYSNTGFSQDGQFSVSVHKADSLYDSGSWNASVVKYKDALKVNDKDGRIWYRLGAAYQAQKLYTEAIEAYKKSLEVKSTVIPPVFVKTNLAKTYALNKDSAKAIALLTEMVNTGYGNFPDLDSAKEYAWLRLEPRFVDLISKATLNAYPCSNKPQNREFDFWIGEWNVYQTGTVYQVGKQRIEKAAGGCLIVENWTASGFPNDGKSMNFISSKTGKWEQVWMGSTGVYLNYYNGQYLDSAMRFDGVGTDKQGNKLLFHLTYFNQGKDKLRHVLEQSADNAKTWTTLYDFTYIKNR